MTSPYPLDTLGLWEAMAGLPEQLAAAAAEVREVLRGTALPPLADLREVLVIGMGTAGLAGDATAVLGRDHATRPILVHKSYGVPAFVGPGTLVFAVSWSGDTEETVAAARAAGERGATLVVVSTGGSLRALAEGEGLPLFALPDGLPASRAALGAMLIPVLSTLAHLGVVPDGAPDLESMIAALSRRRDTLVAVGSEPEEVARSIGRTIPLVYGSDALMTVAAQRWKAQINENAKSPAFASAQPELSHNELAGWGQNGDVTRQVFTLITLGHEGEDPRLARRMALTVDATDEVMSAVIPVRAQGLGQLGRFFDLALFGDVVSLHLAGREGTDPGPVPVISDLQAALR